MARGVSRRPLVRGVKRTSMWIGSRLTLTTVTAGTPTLLATLNAAALAQRPFTIIRTHVMLSIATDQTASAEFVQGALGFQVVTDKAAAAGVASVPTPLGQPDADFFVYQPFQDRFVIFDSTGTQEMNGAGNVWMIDSKAMRKVGPDDDVAVTIENIVNGYVVALEGRILIKLH